MKRDATQVIWRTVVFAGAMLGAPACHGKKASTTPPANTANTTDTTTTTTTAPAEPAKTDTTATTPVPNGPDALGDPCMGGERPRGTDDDGGGGVGRGFVLS